MTNYATAAVPDWAARPWVVWAVFGTLALVALVLGLVGRRLDAAQGDAGRLVPLDRVLAGGMSSLRAPHGPGPVRGRDGDVESLRQLMARPQGRYAVVCGVGGIGKTTLATALAEVARAEGRQVFWIRLRSAGELAEQMSRAALACGLSEARLEEAQAGRTGVPDLVWEHLEAVGKWLIVLDNVDNPHAVGPDGERVAAYRGWIRPGGKGLLLVTSRNTDPAVWGTQAVLHRLDPLEPDIGGRVLLDAAPQAGSADGARALSDRLGGLPLALHAVGSYLAAIGSRHRTFTAYTAALDTEFGTLLGAAQPQASDPEFARSVVRYTWELSLDQLAAGGIPLARPVLRLLSCLAPAPIPIWLITCEVLAESTRQPVNEVDVEAAFNGLHAYGLIDTLQHPGGGSVIGQVVLHPLVREITAHTHAADPNRYRNALSARLVDAARETAEAGIVGWDAARLLAPHLLAAATHPLGSVLRRDQSARFAFAAGPGPVDLDG